MIVPIKQNGDRDIIGKLNEAIKVMGKEEEEEERSLSARATEWMEWGICPNGKV